ncbi:Target of EGR1, member 1 (Nuclear) [Rhizoclosmatium sp. JEL0117]|nr:Target of EGR1, member 1 (Nuclear) [Rhizoclosmatium sp. JEL0117]
MEATRVTRFNIGALSPRLRLELSRASFISFDCEFTGLGDSAATRAQDLRVRYAALRTTATTRGLVSFGVAAFQQGKDDSADDSAAALDFCVTSMGNVVFEPAAAAFLSDHNFDFNKHWKDAVPFKPGNDSSDHSLPGTPNQLIRDLFVYILSLNVPIVIHNGLLDLMFIYQSFYAELPEELDTFVADLADMFPAGLVDTNERKMLKSYHTYLSLSPAIQVNPSVPASILLPNGQISATLSFKLLTKLPDTLKSKKTTKRTKQAEKDEKRLYCVQYASHGYCPNGPACHKSHDLDAILDAEELEAQLNQRKKSKSFTDGSIDPVTVPTTTSNTASATASTEQTPIPIQSQTPLPPITPSLFETYHSACFDAYMTGYVFSVQQRMHPFESSSEFVKAHGNKLYLMGKDVPLHIVKSSFSRTSLEHRRKKKAWSVDGSSGTVSGIAK